MRKNGFKEVNKKKKELQRVLCRSKKQVGNRNKYPFKKEIDLLLKEIPVKKVKKAKKLFNEWCSQWLNRNQQLEQIYRAFYSSFKTRRSYWHFKTASVLLLYLYGYVSDEEIDSIEKGDIDVSIEKIFKKHRGEMEEVKEIDDTLRRKKFMGHIPMNVSCLAIGASIAFTRAVKSILDVIEKLHKNEDYREGHYAGGTIDWDEAILIKGLPYEWVKKGGKEVKWREIQKRKDVSG